jgi:hypothetical protein
MAARITDSQARPAPGAGHPKAQVPPGWRPSEDLLDALADLLLGLARRRLEARGAADGRRERDMAAQTGQEVSHAAS